MRNIRTLENSRPRPIRKNEKFKCDKSIIISCRIHCLGMVIAVIIPWIIFNLVQQSIQYELKSKICICCRVIFKYFLWFDSFAQFLAVYFHMDSWISMGFSIYGLQKYDDFRIISWNVSNFGILNTTNQLYCWPFLIYQHSEMLIILFLL